MEGAEVVRTPGILAGVLSVCLCGTLSPEIRASVLLRDDQFLIVERPHRLVVLNGYQQSLTAQDSLALQAFVPMRILKDRDLLGDGFTPCMSVEIYGRPYYLVRGKDGFLAGERQAGRVERVSGGHLEGDTIRVLRGGALRLTAPDGRGGRRPGGGELLVRLFRSQGKTYVRYAGEPPGFGWVTLSAGSEGRLWERTGRAAKVELALWGRARDSVEAVLARTNGILANLFRFFNQRAGENRPAPQWQLRESGGSLLCTLIGGSPESEYPQSTLYMAKDLEIALAGTEFEVIRFSGGMEIRPK